MPGRWASCWLWWALLGACLAMPSGAGEHARRGMELSPAAQARVAALVNSEAARWERGRVRQSGFERDRVRQPLRRERWQPQPQQPQQPQQQLRRTAVDRRRLQEADTALSSFTCPQDGNLPGNNIRQDSSLALLRALPSPSPSPSLSEPRAARPG